LKVKNAAFFKTAFASSFEDLSPTTKPIPLRCGEPPPRRVAELDETNLPPLLPHFCRDKFTRHKHGRFNPAKAGARKLWVGNQPRREGI